MNQLVRGEFPLGFVAPGDAGAVVEPFRAGLGEAVGQCLDHDRAVGIVGRVEFRRQLVSAMDAYDKAAEEIR